MIGSGRPRAVGLGRVVVGRPVMREVAVHEGTDPADVIGTERLDLRAAGQVGDRLIDVQRGSVVVLRGDGEVRAAQLAPCQTQAFKRLR